MTILLGAQETFNASPSLSIWGYLLGGGILMIVGGLVGPRLWRRRRRRVEAAPEES